MTTHHERIPLCRFVVVALALLLSLPRDECHAQVLSGRILDENTERPLPGVLVALMGTSERRVEILSDEDGAFNLRAPRAATYRLQLTRLGYQGLTTDTFSVARNQLVRITLRMSVAAVPLQPLTVLSRSHALDHDATYDGLYARRATMPAVGNNRVWVKGDRDFEAAIKPVDMLRQIKPRKTEWSNVTQTNEACFPFVFWSGFLIRQRDRAEALLDGSIDNLEGFEVYRDLPSVPLAYREQLMTGPARVRECGVVAMWPRRPDYPRK